MVANGGETPAQRRKECRGFNGLVVANGGANGAEVGGVGSPAAGEADGLGGDGHRRLKEALGGEEGNGRREGGGAGSRAGREPKEK